MSGIVIFVALVLSGMAALLYAVPSLRVLNFVNYDSARTVVRINRYAAVRLLLPALVWFASSWIIETRPKLAMPLIFAAIVSILVSVVWIAAGVTRLQNQDDGLAGVR